MFFLHSKELFFQRQFRFPKLFIAGLSLLPLGSEIKLHAQTLVPGSLGPMSSTQPDRNTAILSGNLLRTGGQDPTIKIVWGDEDRGADASALSTWDNTVVISTNQGVGSFSTTITIPNQDKIYYFRSVAENAGGTVVSRSLGVFTPSAVVGVSDLKGRWSFDDDNFSSLESLPPPNQTLAAKDSSGNAHHGILKKIFTPSAQSNLEFWLDASDASTITHSSNAVSQWDDKSGNGKHATQTTPSRMPTYTVSDSLLNDKSSISSADQNNSIGLDLPSISLQELFVIAYYKGGSDDSFDNNNTLISGSGTTGQYQIMGNYGNNNWFTGSDVFNDNGTFKNGSAESNNTALPMPATLLRFTSSVVRTDTRGILYNTQVADRGWIGGIGEIIGLSATSSPDERQKIEGYLAHKWGLLGYLPSDHPYKLAHPLTEGSPSFILDTPFGDGKAIDLADGHVEISTGGNENVLDGNVFSVSACQGLAGRGEGKHHLQRLCHPQAGLKSKYETVVGCGGSINTEIKCEKDEVEIFDPQ